jgi:hypothetical protein
MYLKKIDQMVQILLAKFDSIEDAVSCCYECIIALSKLPHLNQEVSNAIYEQLDFYRDVIDNLNYMNQKKQ